MLQTTRQEQWGLIKECKLELFLGFATGILLALPLIYVAKSVTPPPPRPKLFIPYPTMSQHHPTPSLTPTPTGTPSATPTEVPNQDSVQNQPTGQIKGQASYYSTNGCLGCSGNLTMANGQPLNDNAYTIAENDLPLGTPVVVTNNNTGASVKAVVTDRGGFQNYGRVADLSLATKEAIGCSANCSVTITL